MSGFIIHLAALARGVDQLEEQATAAELGLAEAQWPGGIEGSLRVDKSGERVSVRGRVEAVARLECVRCLATFDRPVEAELIVYADRGGGSRLERELEDGEYMKFHDGRSLDLREETREALLLELPITPHCREECRGLCPGCGADLNQGACGCLESRERGPSGTRG